MHELNGSLRAGSVNRPNSHESPRSGLTSDGSYILSVADRVDSTLSSLVGTWANLTSSAGLLRF